MRIQHESDAQKRHEHRLSQKCRTKAFSQTSIFLVSVSSCLL